MVRMGVKPDFVARGPDWNIAHPFELGDGLAGRGIKTNSRHGLCSLAVSMHSAISWQQSHPRDVNTSPRRSPRHSSTALTSSGYMRASLTRLPMSALAINRMRWAAYQ